MDLSNLKPPRGARRNRKRRGRGESSGLGRQSGRGNKGQGSRTGNGKISASFEGGQIPLIRRSPKFGFTNIYRKERAFVNVGDLDRFAAGTVVDPGLLREKGIVRKKRPGGVKVLGNGKLTKALTVKAHAFSAKAAELIQKVGGKTEILE